jgi:hypothetical protein
MKAALLFYQRFLKNIKSIGFELTIDHFDTVVHNDIGFVFVIVIIVHWKVSLLGLLGTTWLWLAAFLAVVDSCPFHHVIIIIIIIVLIIFQVGHSATMTRFALAIGSTSDAGPRVLIRIITVI